MDDAPVHITFHALQQRLNRYLAKSDSILKKARGRYDKVEFGDWFVLDMRHNTVPPCYVDPAGLARELGLLAAWETVKDEEK